MIVLVFLSSVAVLVCEQSRNQREPPIHPVDGASIFRNYCAACHGLEGRGNGPVSKVLKREVPDLTSLSLRNGGAFPATHVRTCLLYTSDAADEEDSVD